MLVIKRKSGTSFDLVWCEQGQEITVRIDVIEILRTEHAAKIGITAPKSVAVIRDDAKERDDDQ